MATSVSSYRSGSPRFGTRAPKSVHGDVVIYKLSPEELEAYRNGHSTKSATTEKPFSNIHSDGDKIKEKETRKESAGVNYLSKEEYLSRKNKGISDKKILDEFNMSHNRLNVLKKTWGLIGQFGPAAVANVTKPIETPKAQIVPNNVEVDGPEEKIDIRQKIVIKGVGKDSETIVNEHGGKQSKVLYRFDLCDPKAMFEMTKVLKEGFDKYGDDENWRRISVNEHLNHLLIHAYAYLAGDKSDEHLSHIMCRAMFAQAVDIEHS